MKAAEGSQKRVVLTYGTFDLFHVGHVRLLQRLRSLGTSLVVGLSTDEFNAQKGKRTIIPYEARREVLMSCRYVDRVFPEASWAQKREDVSREGAAIFAMGDDWAGHFDELSSVCEVVYLPRTRDVSTTDIKGWMQAEQQERIASVKSAMGHLNSLIDELAGG